MSNPSLEKAYAYAAELQSAAALSHLPRYVRKSELKQIVPLADTTIYEMEQRNEFPRRIYLTPRGMEFGGAGSLDRAASSGH